MALSSGRAETRAQLKDVVLDFLEALHNDDLQTALDLVDEQIEYVNVSVSRTRGKRRLAKGLEASSRVLGGFDVLLVNIAQNGDIVLIERFDTLKLGPLWTKFWVFGRFEVKNGRITVWRDSFDLFNVAVGTARAFLGALIPALRPKQTHQLGR
ncbi:limonene-1,2-epoxide hydrolase family protein [Segniliparus rugosus]|uniref:Limonene-1,2-epoxide hydrolase domain-containing protein n=1 Tax=Segniliparus rugosus (strain ATCC BAA-974 / DSM 45345 / CCUG 50838 / CIP 108380 / JCM 13579 / CDC 945) TaxID=679197 RepID=E5XTU2_SEGRC|nr:limonene-1,2-epoxide hydrolase family protein [Segniliparus rugosus]EFV12222.1 hypothetical protein HMPREF9336_02914 [Segniliparus rugosus ATCC BAA-974]